jgi:hypothetical protein
VAGLLGLLGALHGPSLVPGSKTPDIVAPKRLDPTSTEMQVVCNVQGYLQLLAKYSSDSFTAFDFLDLNPHTRPFFPARNSRLPKDTWYHEVQEAVDNRYTKLMEAVSRDDRRYGDRHRQQQYKAALTAASDLLSKDDPRRYYTDTIMPMLEDVVRNQPPQCVWPRIRRFHRNLCAATWPTTGMIGLLQDDGDFRLADSGCFNAADDASALLGICGGQ